MEKEFVPYDLAVKLKALGFDEPCFGFYQKEYAEVRPIMIDDDEQYRLTGFRTCKNSEIPERYISAPTFSQAFRWFREKYGLHCGINTHTSSTNQITYVIDLEFGKKLTYEEAELAALTRLIEIVESKSE